MKKILFFAAATLCMYNAQAQTPLESSQAIGYASSGSSKADTPSPDPYNIATGNNIGRVGAGVVRVHTGLEISGGYFEMPLEPTESPESIEIVKVFVTCNATWSAQSASIAIYAGTTEYTGLQQAWESPGSMTLIATKTTQGSYELEVTGSAFTAMKNWLDDRGFDKKKIYFTLRFSDEDNTNANFNGLSLRVQYHYKYKLSVTVDDDYDGNIGSVSGTYTATVQIGGRTSDFIAYKDETITLSLNQAGTIGSNKYAFNNMELDGSGHSNSNIAQRIYSFNLTGFTTASVDYVPGVNVTLDNQVQFLSGPTGRITNSTLRASQAGIEIATVNAGNSVIAPQNGTIDYTTLWGNYGEDLNYQSTKIKHQNWNSLTAKPKLTLTEQATGTATNTAWYHELKPATVAATLEGVAAGNVTVQMKDPWRVVGGIQPGNWDNYNTTTSNSLGLGNSSTVAGVFQGVQYFPDNPNAAHYRLKANPQVISGVQSYLTNWSATNAEIYSSTLSETPVKFNASGATVTANYKASFASNNSSALVNSGQRKIVRTTTPPLLHMVYESMGYIWYETSTDNGSTWTLMNNNQPIDQGKNPSITSIQASPTLIFITYQSNYSVKLKCFTHVIGTTSTFNYAFEATDITSNLAYSTTLLDAKPVIACNLGSGGNVNVFLAWEGYRIIGLATFVKTIRYWSAQLISPYPQTYSGFYTGTNGFISDATTSSANPTLAIPTMGNFKYQLAWQEGTSSIMYKQIDLGMTQGTTYNVSSGNGYTHNYSPSIIATTNINFPARLSWVASRVEKSEELLKATADGEWVYRTMFTDPSSLGTFWSFGYDVNSTNLNINAADNGYIVAWSKSNGINQYTRNSSLGGQIRDFKISGAAINGKDVQVVSGSSFSDMYGIMLNTQSFPYQFKRSDNIFTLGKESEATEVFSGREGIVSKGNAQFYFTLGDITLDGENIEFEDMTDTTTINSRNLVNQYLVSKPFTLNNQSDFSYGVMYGLSDSTECANLLTDGSIGFKVQLVNDQTGEVIGEFDNVTYTSDNIFQYQNIGYQVNTNGIGNVTVRLKLIVESNLEAKYRLGSKHNTESITVIGKAGGRKKHIGYQGALVITEYALSQNFPNPFNPTTTISYAIPQDGMTALKIYDALGREVKTLVNEFKTTGRYTAEFDASRLASGIYIYKLVSGEYSAVKKMLLLK